MTFPCIRILVERRKLTLHGAYFGVATGELLVRDPDTGAFAPAVADKPGVRSRSAAGETAAPFSKP